MTVRQTSASGAGWPASMTDGGASWHERIGGALRSSSADARLAEQIRSGDREAMREVFDRYSPVVLSLASDYAPDREMAESLVHDAFVMAWQRIHLFDSARSTMREWLSDILHEVAGDGPAAAAPGTGWTPADQAVPLIPTQLSDGRDAPFADNGREVRAGIDALRPDQRRVLELACREGYTYREIGRLTGTPEQVVLASLREALSAVRGSPAVRGLVPVATGRGFSQLLAMDEAQA